MESRVQREGGGATKSAERRCGRQPGRRAAKPKAPAASGVGAY